MHPSIAREHDLPYTNNKITDTLELHTTGPYSAEHTNLCTEMVSPHFGVATLSRVGGTYTYGFQSALVPR